MVKLIFFAGLFSLQALAVTPLIQKHVKSGFIAPENSFEYDCSINDDRHIIVTRREGIHPPSTTIRHLTKFSRNNIRSLVHLAAYGSITDSSPTCDGGDRLVYGFHHGTKFIIDENLDCGTHKVNQSRAASALKSLASRFCRF